MSSPQASTLLLVHSDASLLTSLSGLLSRHGFRVVSTPTLREANQVFQHFAPDLVLAAPAVIEAERAELARLVEARPGATAPALAAIVQPGTEDRLRALRLGLTQQLAWPGSEEEILLVVGAMLGWANEAPQALTGKLEDLAVPELLTMFGMNRKDVRIGLESQGRRAFIQLARGEVTDAADGSGARGEEAMNRLLDWKTGSFTVDFGAPPPTETVAGWDLSPEPTPVVAAPAPEERAPAPAERNPAISVTTSAPPASPAAARHLVVHRALALLNVVASFASGFVQQPMLSRKLEAVRATLAERHRALAYFTVSAEGAIGLSGPAEADLAAISPRLLVEATAEWVLALVFELQRTFPGSLPKATLRILAESAGDDVGSLGFLRALGLD
jgi:DNA-binding response OmpR family regulator